jgi:hypothetical protein
MYVRDADPIWPQHTKFPCDADCDWLQLRLGAHRPITILEEQNLAKAARVALILSISRVYFA